MCPQRNVLFDELTVSENVWLWNKVKSGLEDSAALQDLIEGCDMALKASSRAGNLSGGQKRKLQLACAFVGGSSLCLMDEVTTGLVSLFTSLTGSSADSCYLCRTHFLVESSGTLSSRNAPRGPWS
jgi:ATP-binding cassette, subfamily A (ABC1), member 3